MKLFLIATLLLCGNTAIAQKSLYDTDTIQFLSMTYNDLEGHLQGVKRPVKQIPTAASVMALERTLKVPSQQSHTDTVVIVGNLSGTNQDLLIGQIYGQDTIQFLRQGGQGTPFITSLRRQGCCFRWAH